MNLYKVYAALVIFLSVCTYDAEGGLILLLLLKIIALKGALFFGVPLALGSFLLGQGVGFFGGTVFGGYGVLHAAHKYLSRPKHVAHHVIQKPVHVHHGPPKFNHGWGWQTTPGFHVYKYQSGPKPTIWNKISSIPGILTNRLRKRPSGHHHHNHHGHDHGHGWQSSPGWTKSQTSSYHGQNPLNTYYETEDSDKHLHHGMYLRFHFYAL
ncbi:unnamed protein product [Allacma fusca]|uniref:Uncharacterized protein n=1 Tax=Allacma fusca TaxID=39272 RepID=A0A8J2JXW0_9HEXA|nr:unnamed protein product [Allacma fusca]